MAVVGLFCGSGTELGKNRLPRKFGTDARTKMITGGAIRTARAVRLEAARPTEASEPDRADTFVGFDELLRADVAFACRRLMQIRRNPRWVLFG